MENRATDAQFKIVAYMDAATELAESIRLDIRAGDTISNETVLKLSEFMQAAAAAERSLALLNKMIRQYN